MSSSSSQSSSGSSSASQSVTGSTNASSTTTSSVSIPLNAPQGAVVITQPPTQAAYASYFKIAPSQTITFGWNFTNLYVTPSSLTVSAVCENGYTYPVGPRTDGALPGDATSVEWSPYEYQQSYPNQPPFAVTMYTLQIWGDGGPSATPTPGYLGPNNDALQFGMYTTQAYTPLSSGWQCIGCSGSLANYVADPAIIGVTVTLLVTALSGFGMLNRIPL